MRFVVALLLGLLCVSPIWAQQATPSQHDLCVEVPAEVVALQKYVEAAQAAETLFTECQVLDTDVTRLVQVLLEERELEDGALAEPAQLYMLSRRYLAYGATVITEAQLDVSIVENDRELLEAATKLAKGGRLLQMAAALLRQTEKDLQAIKAIAPPTTKSADV